MFSSSCYHAFGPQYLSARKSSSESGTVCRSGFLYMNIGVYIKIYNIYIYIYSHTYTPMCIYGIIYDPVQPQRQACSQGVQPAPLYDNCSFGKMDSAHLGLYNMCADVKSYSRGLVQQLMVATLGDPCSKRASGPYMECRLGPHRRNVIRNPSGSAQTALVAPMAFDQARWASRAERIKAL